MNIWGRDLRGFWCAVRVGCDRGPGEGSAALREIIKGRAKNGDFLRPADLSSVVGSLFYGVLRWNHRVFIAGGPDFQPGAGCGRVCGAGRISHAVAGVAGLKSGKPTDRTPPPLYIYTHGIFQIFSAVFLDGIGKGVFSIGARGSRAAGPDDVGKCRSNVVDTKPG